MHILLPPSETKCPGGGDVYSASALSNHRELGAARDAVRTALESLSANREAAERALKLGAKNRSEIERNLSLGTSGALPAIDRYTGVLFDALGAASLGSLERMWLTEHVSIQSALFGLVNAHDAIPAYRLSATTRLPALGTSLKRHWAPAHAALDWTQYGWLLDLRSQDYAALAPAPEELSVSLLVVERSDDGQQRALNHFNKAAKGDLVKRLAQDRPTLDEPSALVEWGFTQGLELNWLPEERRVVLVTTRPSLRTRNAA